MSRTVAPTGTMRAACDVLAADLEAAVTKLRNALGAYDSEEMTAEELVAITPVQMRLATSVRALHMAVQGFLNTTLAMREAKGIPVTDAEIEGACECDDCKAKVAARVVN